MKALARYVMKGRTQAAMMATLFAVLTLVLPPLSYISGAIIGLVTLRRGPGDGLIVAAISAAVMGLLASLTLGNYYLAVIFAGAVWLPVWATSLLLRRTISMSLAVVAAGVFSAIVVLLVHSMLPDPTVWWRKILETLFAEAASQAPDVNMTEMGGMLDSMAAMMTGMLSALFFMSLVFSVSLARWWQAVLYNPGGFGQEFRALRLGKTFGVIAALVTTGAVFGHLGDILADLAILLVTVFALPGLALVHDWADKTKAHPGWLIALYVLLGFVMPQIIALLGLIGLADTWLDLRRYFKKPAQPGL